MHSDPDGGVWLPMECDTTLLDHKWFWGHNTDSMLKGLDQLMDIYYRSVGHGCVLLLNSTPDTTGLIPELHVKRYEEFGREIGRRFGKPLAETRGEGDAVELDLGRPTAINHAITMEDIREGQRVRAYRLEGFSGGKWENLGDQRTVDRTQANRPVSSSGSFQSAAAGDQVGGQATHPLPGGLSRGGRYCHSAASGHVLPVRRGARRDHAGNSSRNWEDYRIRDGAGASTDRH